ncbi:MULTISPECIES: ATP-binding protein [Halomonadaceae]|jgi:two-component system sensor histidine kinase RstB|uniref:ATP-binding protein n=1 Tax=Halomonadaceae TaxID=28256 RepID=UPI001581F968|nr:MULTISPECIES: ATP-binding protein [Halomonas]MDI4639077.1 ATP-binding protein [Halomonas sp. BMC7]NUJ60068.1 HAMP domain-containing protein [Halomonas taeanensis]|tara:strand:+ start:787 stop:2436 length:1650 start_codon:yes stop_codon:yes gene_type:complete
MVLSRLLPRPLADSAFLRVYVWLALALVLTFVLALSTFALVDKVRHDHYREQLAEAPMTLLSLQLAALPLSRRDAWLARKSEQLSMALSLHDTRNYPLNFFQRTSLENDRTLVDEVGEADGQGWTLYRQLPGETWMLRAELESLSEQQLLGLARQLGEWLAEVNGEARLERLERLQSSVIQAQLTDTPPEDLPPAQIARLRDTEVVIQLLPQRWAMTLYLRLPTAGGGIQWVEVGPLAAFEPMSLSLSLSLLVAMLGVLAGIIYMIVRGVESRMARLEQAATRIACGHLNTRVKVESGDFLGRVGMAFNGMASQVQALLRAQQEMIRAVSHELRTPVARIRFAVQMVEDMTDSGPVRRQLSGIDGDIEELDGLIDEILTYAKLGNDHAQGVLQEAELVDCRDLADNVVEALAPLHAKLTLQVMPGPPVEVVADPRYLQRALQNLVANACRHASSQVRLALSDDGQVARLDVEDDGPGVPVAEREEIFKPFARLDDSRTRRSGGYGLGLSIVHKVMLWHGGSVMVDDSPSLGGARFSLLLPLKQAGVTPA